MKTITLLFTFLILTSCSKDEGTLPALVAKPLSNRTDLNEQVDNRHEISKSLDAYQYESVEFEKAVESYRNLISSKHLTESIDDTELVGHIADMSKIISDIKTKNVERILCNVVKFEDCSSTTNFESLINKMSKRYIRNTNVLRDFGLDLLILNSMNDEQRVLTLNTNSGVSLLQNRIHSLAKRRGISNALIVKGLKLYSSFFKHLDEDSTFKVLDPFVRDFRFENMSQISNVIELFETYIFLLADKLPNSNYEMNDNQVRLITAYANEDSLTSFKRGQVNKFFFISGKSLPDNTFLIQGMLDTLIYNSYSVQEEDDLSRLINLPFSSNRAQNIKDLKILFNNSFKVEESNDFDVYRLNLLDVQIAKSRKTSIIKLKRVITKAVNSYYGTNLTAKQVFNFESYSFEDIIKNSEKIDNNTVNIEVNPLRNRLPVGVFGYPNTHIELSVTSSVVSHPLTFINTNGKNIKLTSSKVEGLSIITSKINHEFSEKEVAQIQLDRDFLPLLPSQKVEEVSVTRLHRNRNHEYSRACSAQGSGEDRGEPTLIKVHSIVNEDAIDFVSKPELSLDGRSGADAGKVEVGESSSLSKLYIFSKGTNGENGQPNGVLDFSRDSYVRHFQNKVVLECKFLSVRCEQEQMNDYYNGGPTRDCHYNKIATIDYGERRVQLRQPAPGKGGTGGNGGLLTLKGNVQDVVTVVGAGRGGEAGYDVLFDRLFDAKDITVNASSYFPSYDESSIEWKITNGKDGLVKYE